MKQLKTGMVGFLALVVFASAEVIDLPRPDITGGIPLMEALALRRTSRTFSERALDLQTLSDLLWAASGVNRPDEGKLTAPTAGNRQQMDVYVTLPEGLYRYDAPANRLVRESTGDLREKAGKQSFTDTAPLNLVFVADFDRMRGDEERRVFYSATDTGYISQNVYLFCASRGLNTVVLGYVDKEGLAKAMGLRSAQRVILSQTVGYPPSGDAAAKGPVLRDGRWRGTGKGYDGDVVVDVVVRAGRITGVELVRHQESAPGGAFDDLPGRIVARQGADVDVVSGATVTSRAVLEAVEKALEKSRRVP